MLTSNYSAHPTTQGEMVLEGEAATTVALSGKTLQNSTSTGRRPGKDEGPFGV
jgi:hypothetical protein